MSVRSDAGLRPTDEVVVSVVLPVFNEERVLETLTRSVLDAIGACHARPELIFVNDGSYDSSGSLLDAIASSEPDVRVLHLSRNFGHQAAVQAGLSHASGDVVVVMDSDLQDDPNGIGRFLEKWREGYDIVYAIRYGRKENALKRFLFYAFYRVLRGASKTPMPIDAGNFGLLDRRVATAVVRLLDRDRYFAGLRSWVGYRQVGVPVERGPRYDGRPRVTLRGLCRLAQSAIFSFSTLPLTAFYVISLTSLILGVGLCGFTLYHKLFTGAAISGWASMTITARAYASQ